MDEGREEFADVVDLEAGIWEALEEGEAGGDCVVLGLGLGSHEAVLGIGEWLVWLWGVKIMEGRDKSSSNLALFHILSMASCLPTLPVDLLLGPIWCQEA